jgi:peptide-methionine (S)-S-oxide reductase
VIRTRAGYTGGDRLNPTYENIGDHTESVQVDFDPARVSYQQLLQVFWASHDPFEHYSITQYKVAVFYADAQQERLARESLAQIEKQSGRKVNTQILPLKKFYRAEDYHQKYYLRHTPQLLAELAADYGGDERAFADSTLAARLNAYSGRHGNPKTVQAELASYALSQSGQSYLLSIAPALREEPVAGCALP